MSLADITRRKTMNSRILHSLKSALVALLTILGLFTVTNLTASTVEAKELTGVITSLQHLNSSDATLTPDATRGYSGSLSTVVG